MDYDKEINELVVMRDRIINEDYTCYGDRAINELQRKIDNLVEEKSICEAEANAESRMFERC